MATDSTALQTGGMPAITYEVQYPETLSRWLIFVKWLLAIPHFIILYALSIAASIVWIISFFAILFTASIRKACSSSWSGSFAGMPTSLRTSASCATSIRRSRWTRDSIRSTVDVAYPTDLNRWLVLIKWLLVIPHLLVLVFVFLAVFVTQFIAWFAILFTEEISSAACSSLPSAAIAGISA